ncbi:MAG: TonB-dependent receptor [Candidatus Polarisedimenticolaceae bacterium]|nr:TonB-dependent receptor [Candidatus Polarisedimenticolaceae bacterium]
MTYKKTSLALALSFALSPGFAVSAEEVSRLDELVVEGEGAQAPTTHYTSPTTRITDIEAESISVTTVEDFIKYEPGMVVRRRYIGDSNGVVGMRGSNMFQTTRTMVYADGLPLHYLLQTRFSGAPRWSLVAPDETRAVEVVYGPFSAEYSGNAMGGVINIETKLPQEREFHAEASYFAQDYDHLGTDETFEGNRQFFSYGDKYGDLSLYLFHSRLENESQPQSIRYNTSKTLAGGETAVTGAYTGQTSTGGDIINYADSGSEDVVTNLTKLKLGYEFGDWLARFTLAYEERDRDTDPSNYLVDAAGNPFWSGEAAFNGRAVTVRRSHFSVSEQDRDTVLVGLGLEGPIGTSSWTMKGNFSYFDVMEDERRQSDENPADPTYDRSGRITEYDDTGWETLDLKAHTERFLGRSDMNFVAGYHYDHYSLEIHSYNSSDYTTGEKTSRRQSTGGETFTHAIFGQWGWNFAPAWDVALGARYERWKMEDGFYYKWGGDMENYKDRTERGFSPKFSLGLTPQGLWKYRYSVAKAYRFPIVEELYKNEEATNSTSIADADLEPEIGIHHNLMAERKIPGGFLRVNLYHEVIDDVIFSQRITLPDSTTVSSFLPIDEVTTTGLEFMLQQSRVFNTNLDVRFNVAYTDSEVTQHDADPSMEGNNMPRMPDWRSNLLLSYHINAMWDSSVGVRYASNSYGRLDNTDDEEQVFGAQDSYTFVDLKVNFRPTKESRIGFGVDNVTDEKAFVYHPWAQRSFYMEGSIDF